MALPLTGFDLICLAVPSESPQGSCLGSLLLTVCADDSQLCISFSPKAHSGQADAVAAIEHCIQDIKQWMSEDKLLMNDAKTEFLLIGTTQQLAKVTIDGITIGRSDIAQQSLFRNLGVWPDDSHITKTSSAAFYYLYNIRRIRKYLSTECTDTLMHALVSSRIDYCSSLLYGLRRFKFRNAAARLVFELKANSVTLHHF